MKICKRCVMNDSSDDSIIFDENGICNYCTYSLSRLSTVYYPNEIGAAKLQQMMEMLKKEGKNKKYDCLMGISGGLDSAYLAYLGAKKWGLRILAVHIDDGFNTEIADRNIKELCEKCNIDLEIIKPNKEEYCDLIKSFIRAEVPSLAIPQDNVLQAYLKMYALKYDLKYFLSGANFALESILQRGDAHIASDNVHIAHIHKLYGEIPLKNLPTISLLDRYLLQKYLYKIQTLRPLDLIDYNRERAINELEENVNFQYYGGKHYESIFTKFVQAYYLPKKFNIDKRSSHFSSLIVSGQMTREQALKALQEPLYNANEMEKDIQYILNEINMDYTEFNEIMNKNGKKHSDYKFSTWIKFRGVATKFRKVLGE